MIGQDLRYAQALNAYYDAVDERARWPENRGHQLERRVTCAYLHRMLKLNSRVLDCRAGIGAYCFGLVKAGHIAINQFHTDLKKAFYRSTPQEAGSTEKSYVV